MGLSILKLRRRATRLISRRSAPRTLKFDRLEDRCMLAVGPLLWMEDNNLGIAGGLPEDFIERFNDISTWQHTLRAIDTIYLRENSLRNSDNGLTDGVIRSQIAPVLNAYQVDVAIDTGAATWLGYRSAITGRSPEQLLAGHFDYLESLRDAGFQVRHVSLQSVLSRRHQDHASWEEYPIDDRIEDVATYARLVAKRFPDIRLGIIDALPTHGRNWRQFYSDLALKLDAQGTPLGHVHLDAPVDLVGIVGSSDYKLTWTDVVNVQRFVQDDMGAKFGLMLTSSSGGATSAARWRQDIFSRGMARYHEALGGDAAPQQQPDRIIVSAWYEHPRFSVPEQNPDGSRADTLTGAAVQISNFIRGDRGYSVNRLTDEVQQVFPVNAVASSIASPEWNAENAVFARGIVNASSVLERYQWKPAADDSRPWVIASLPGAVNLDRMRVWPLQQNGAAVNSGRLLVLASNSGTGSPIDPVSDWHQVASADLSDMSSGYIDMTFEVINTRFIAIVLEAATFPQGRGLAAMRVYSPNNNWNQHVGAIVHAPGNHPPYLHYHRNIHIDQSKTDGQVVSLQWAYEVLPAPPLAPNDESAQAVFLEVLHEQSDISDALFSRAPEISGDGVLSVFPAPHAIGSAVIVIRATDYEDLPNFVPRSTLARP